MSVQRALRAAALAGAVFILAGCGGGPSVAPVSGKVTLDGKPLVKAQVAFQPMATEDNFNPGPCSQAFTGDDGSYQLKLITGKEGAIVGKHRIQIFADASGDVKPVEVDVDSEEYERPRANGRVPLQVIYNAVPAKFNRESQLTFEVTSAGSKEANFNLASK